MGNVAHTVLNGSDVSLWLRIPFAVVWPVALFVGIEILVRVNWRAKFTDHAGRVLLVLPVSAVAAIVSWLHLHHLMVMSEEPMVAALIGPFAVDGLMLGSTVALLAIRAASLDTLPEPAPAPIIEPAPEPAVATEVAEVVRKPRRKWDAGQVIAMVMDGTERAKVIAETEIGGSTLDRYRRVAKMLKTDPRMVIDAARERIPAEHIVAMRELVGR